MEKSDHLSGHTILPNGNSHKAKLCSNSIGQYHQITYQCYVRCCGYFFFDFFKSMSTLKRPVPAILPVDHLLRIAFCLTSAIFNETRLITIYFLHSFHILFSILFVHMSSCECILQMAIHGIIVRSSHQCSKQPLAITTNQSIVNEPKAKFKCKRFDLLKRYIHLFQILEPV